eukprot:gene11443-21646_t
MDAFLNPTISNDCKNHWKSSTPNSVVKVMCSKVKSRVTRKGKRHDARKMEIKTTNVGEDAIVEKNGKLILRHGSFHESKPRRVSRYENVSYQTLVSLTKDVVPMISGNSCVSHDSISDTTSIIDEKFTTGKGNTSETVSGFLDDELPQFRRERRGAIAEVSRKDRENIVKELQKRALARSLSSGGLLRS